MDFLLWLAEYFKMSLFEMGALVAITSGIVIGSWAMIQIGKRNFTDREIMLMAMLEDFILSTVVKVINQDVDLAPYEEKADARAKEGLTYLDPRMLFVLDQADDWVSKRSGFNVDFEELAARAERIYQEYKNK